MARPLTCICGNILQLPENMDDVKCANCGRVFNYQGRFLWKEAAGNDLVGSSPLEPGGVDRRADDQDSALVEAFIEGKLPEKDRRDDAPEVAPEVVTEPRGRSGKK